MKNVFKCIKKDKKTGADKQVGSIEINNSTSEKAELRFYGDIVSNTWESYWFEEDKCPQDIADFLAEIPNDKPIDIFINSGGGNVHAGLAIFHQLKRHSGHKTAHTDGIAASTAGFLLMVADEIIMPESAQLMMHKPWSRRTGDADDMRKEADVLDLCQESIVSIFMSKAKDGVSKETIVDMINKETWLSGTKAANYFDIKVEEGKNAMDCASDYFDKYKHLPENLKSKMNNKEKECAVDYEKIADMVTEKVISSITLLEDKAQPEKLNETEKQAMLLELDVI